MTTITSKHEQRVTAAAARKVGGYANLVRLAAEKSRHGKDSIVQRDAKSGQWMVIKTAGKKLVAKPKSAAKR